MAKLVLDLDLTAIGTKFYENRIDPFHKLEWLPDQCTLNNAMCYLS